MEDKHSKPLRTSFNKVKDVYKTYVRNNDEKNMNHSEHPNTQQEKEMQEKEINEKIENALKNENNDKNTSSNEEAFSNSSEDQNKLIAEIEQLEFKIDDLEKERDKYKDQLMRLTAEMENFRRRTQKEKEELIYMANEKLLAKLLEIPDDMSNALEAAKKNSDSETLLTGINMIYNKVKKLFEEAGVKEMSNVVGSQFDVDYHDALMNMPHDSVPEGHVIQVVQTGYLIGDKVLRHAKVLTSAGKAE